LFDPSNPWTASGTDSQFKIFALTALKMRLLIKFRFMANAVWTTEEAVEAIKQAD
jgi:hypothetical protein